MVVNEDRLLTIGDLDRDFRFEGFTKRQIEYAIYRGNIQPVGRLGIIRAFSTRQIPVILEALQRTRGKRVDTVA